MQTLDTDTYELCPGEELTTGDAAEFVVTRSGFMNGDLRIPLTFGGEVGTDLMPDGTPAQFKFIVVSETNTSNNTWQCDLLLTHNSILMQSGVSSVTIKMQALSDDMMADPEDDPRAGTVSVGTSSAYCLGENSGGTFYIHDTSTMAGQAAATLSNPTKYPFPDFTPVHPAAPTVAGSYTVVIVGGGAASTIVNGKRESERDIWAASAAIAYPGAYIYNDVMNASQLASVIDAFPDGSIANLRIGGHGTFSMNVGIQPTNNSTVVPMDYGCIDDDTITGLGNDWRNVFRTKLAAGAWVDIESCGTPRTEAGAAARRSNARALATWFQHYVEYAVGATAVWNQICPDSYLMDGETPPKWEMGHWEIASPGPP